MQVHRPRYHDAFNPTLMSSESLDVSQEQQNYIKEILSYSCSDSRFAQKAFASIWLVLTKGSVVTPSLGSLNPSSAIVGSPSFTLHVIGTGFNEGSKILFNGGEEVTTRVSDTELTTEVNMDTVLEASTVPVQVVSGDGVPSNSQSFVFQPVARSGDERKIGDKKIEDKRKEDERKKNEEQIRKEQEKQPIVQPASPLITISDLEVQKALMNPPVVSGEKEKK